MHVYIYVCLDICICRHMYVRTYVRGCKHTYQFQRSATMCQLAIYAQIYVHIHVSEARTLTEISNGCICKYKYTDIQILEFFNSSRRVGNKALKNIDITNMMYTSHISHTPASRKMYKYIHINSHTYICTCT